MSNEDFSAYSDFLKDAAKDDAVGRQNFMVVDVTKDQWPSGDPRLKVRGCLSSLNRQPKCEITFSELPSPETIKNESAGWETAKKKGVAQSINMRKALARMGKKPDDLQAGDELEVEVVRNKEGFLRIVAIIGPPKSGAAKRSNDKDIPF